MWFYHEENGFECGVKSVRRETSLKLLQRPSLRSDGRASLEAMKLHSKRKIWTMFRCKAQGFADELYHKGKEKKKSRMNASISAWGARWMVMSFVETGKYWVKIRFHKLD